MNQCLIAILKKWVKINSTSLRFFKKPLPFLPFPRKYSGRTRTVGKSNSNSNMNAKYGKPSNTPANGIQTRNTSYVPPPPPPCVGGPGCKPPSPKASSERNSAVRRARTLAVGVGTGGGGVTKHGNHAQPRYVSDGIPTGRRGAGSEWRGGGRCSGSGSSVCFCPRSPRSRSSVMHNFSGRQSVGKGQGPGAANRGTGIGRTSGDL